MQYFKLKIALIIVLIMFLLSMSNIFEYKAIGILGFLSCISCLLSFLVFDELIEHEFKEHQSQWEDDGQPGFFRWPKGRRIPWYDDPQKKLMRKWLLFTPDWIKQDKYAKILIWTYRIFIINFLAGAVIGLFL